MALRVGIFLAQIDEREFVTREQRGAHLGDGRHGKRGSGGIGKHEGRHDGIGHGDWESMKKKK
ncbi:hypothetical protein BGC_22040 [Burkholderia sp. 3C]